MRRYAILSAAAAAVVLPAAAHATLIAADSYLTTSNAAAGAGGYTVGGSLASQYSTVTVPGFLLASGGGTGTSNFQVTANTLNSPVLGITSNASSGKVSWLGYGADNNTRSTARNLSPAAPTSSVYYESYLINGGSLAGSTTAYPRSILEGFGNATTPGYGITYTGSSAPGTPATLTGLFVGFAEDGTATGQFGNLVIRYPTANNTDADQIVLANNAADVLANNTYLVVAEIDVPSSGTNDTVNWWVNPTNMTSDATMTAASAASGTFSAPVIGSASDFVRLNYISQGWNNPAYLDEPRLSTDLASLVAGPVVVTGPSNLTWTGANDGSSWDTATPNFNNASGTAVAFNSGTHDNVTFNDANNGNYDILPYGTLTPGSTTVNSSGNYVFGNGQPGEVGIQGTGPLIKLGTGSLTLQMSNSYTGGTNVSGGSLILAVNGALPSGGSLNISGGSVVASGLGSSTTLKVSTISITGTGTLDLQNTGLDVTTSSLTTVFALLKNGYNGGNWNGSAGIVSSTAAANSSHLTALGVVVNDNGSGTPLYGTSGTLGSTFDGTTPADGDVLVKYTYYGDTNLSGKVDGTDYGRIDAAYLADKTNPTASTGWYNGDFNYDGVINGSDYTLIDNAFNAQGTALTSQIASPLASSTAEIADTSAVPEPTTLGLMLMSAVGLLGRRKKQA